MQKIAVLIAALLLLTTCSSDQKDVDVFIAGSSSLPLEKTLGEQEESKTEQIEFDQEEVLARPNPGKKKKSSSKKDKKISEVQKVDAGIPRAKDVFLIRISSNYNTKTYDLAVEVNKENLIQSIKVRNNKKNKTKVYGLDRLGKEMTLVKTGGISLVTLKCLNFSQDQGCKIEIEYPYNLTYGNFDTFYAEIRKDGNHWRFFSGTKPFRQMRLIAKKLFGLLIGVEKVELFK